MGNLHQQSGTLPPAPDRRTEPRNTPSLLTQLDFGDGHGGIILNISEAGMAVAVGHVPAVGDRLSGISFLLPDSGSKSIQSVQISAEIVWLSDSKRGAGMRFIGLSADARKRISNWIASERMAREFEHLPKLVRRNERPLEISSHRSRPIFSSQSIRNEEAFTLYTKMFPSENVYSKAAATLDEIGAEDPLPSASTPISAPTPTRAVGKSHDSPSAMSMVSIPDIRQSPPTAFPLEDSNVASEPLQTSNRNGREPLTPNEPEPQTADNKTELSPASASVSPSDCDPSETSAERGFKFQFAIFGFVLVAISLILGLTAGYAPIEKRLRSFRKPARPPATTLSAPPATSSGSTSSEPGKTLDAPSEEAPPDKEESEPEIPPVPSHPQPSNSLADATASAPSSPHSRNTRPKNDPDSSLKTHKRENASSQAAHHEKSGTLAESPAPTPPHFKNPNPSPTAESKESTPTAAPESQPEERNDRVDSTTRPAENLALSTSSKTERVAPPPAAVGATSEPSPDPAALSSTPPASPTPAPRPAPRPAPAPANVVIPPAENGKVVRAVLPRKSIADSPGLGITSQLSVLISPGGRVTEGDHETVSLQAGDVITYVVPHQPRPGDRYKSTETVKVRATIGRDGRVTEVRPVDGPIFLLTSVVSAVRQWSFHPTLVNGRPVQAQDDVTIEFRLQR